MFAGKKSAQIREILISESAWEEMTCLFAPSLSDPYSESEWLSCMIIQTNTRTRQLQLYRNSEDFYPSPLTRG
ncbi:hypothetical protein GRW74_16210 [Escherichia coli]|nr:hypothetical protein [Escherichia coli]